jgi:hypothetical protein
MLHGGWRAATACLGLTEFSETLRRARQLFGWLGVLGIFAGLLAAFAATLVLSVSLLHNKGSRGTDAGTPEFQRSEKPKFDAGDYQQSRFPKVTGRPLIGVNYTHYEFPNCYFLRRKYVLAAYQNPGVATTVHQQLMQMRSSGIESIRTVIWYDAVGQKWGPIPAPAGILREPFRTNLIRYVTEIKRFGFARLTIAFEPKRANNPLLHGYRPTRFAENWRFIRQVRSIVKRYGPRQTRFDLLGEGAPNATATGYEPLPSQTGRYLRDLYRLYVRRYGNRDVSVSAITSQLPYPTNRLENLIRILRSAGETLPRWYDVHIGFDAHRAAYGLRTAESQLKRQAQIQPLVIDDAGYDSPAIAKVIRRFVRRTGRRLEEVTPWYTRTRLGCPVPPPYVPGAYATLRKR